MNFRDNCCHGCQERTAECHATCEKYQQFAKECEELRMKRREINRTYERRAGMESAIKRHIRDNTKRRKR